MSDEIRVFGSPVKLGVVSHEALDLVELAQQDENGVVVIRYLMPEDAQRLRDRLDAALAELSGARGRVDAPGMGVHPQERCKPGIYSTDYKGNSYDVKYSLSGAPLFEGRPGHWWWSLTAAVEDRHRYEAPEPA